MLELDSLKTIWTDLLTYICTDLLPSIWTGLMFPIWSGLVPPTWTGLVSTSDQLLTFPGQHGLDLLRSPSSSKCSPSCSEHLIAPAWTVGWCAGLLQQCCSLISRPR